MDTEASSWLARRTSRWQDYSAELVLDRKKTSGARISVVIPARDESRTIGPIVELLRRDLVDGVPIVDELVVMDSDSSDGTGAAATAAGASVHRTRDVRPDLGSYAGKGEALWKSLFVTSGDLLVFVDADLTLWGTHFVIGLLGPLLCADGVALVKGFYDRVRTEADGSTSTEGGRVTELVARPLLSLWWPHLAGVVQPLAGEWAARRTLLESLPIPVGYGIEFATLVDTEQRHGLDAVAQVDLGSRAHRHQADHDLGVMAAELLLLAAARAGGRADPRADPQLHQFVRVADALEVRTRPVPDQERPPASNARIREPSGGAAQ